MWLFAGNENAGKQKGLEKTDNTPTLAIKPLTKCSVVAVHVRVDMLKYQFYLEVEAGQGFAKAWN